MALSPNTNLQYQKKNTEFQNMSTSIQLMLFRKCKYLQIDHYFNITTENYSEFNFRGIINGKKNALNLYVFIRQPNNSKSSLNFQIESHAM